MRINPETLQPYTDQQLDQLALLDEMLESLQQQGAFEVVGNEFGRPVYTLTALGRSAIDSPGGLKSLLKPRLH